MANDQTFINGYGTDGGQTTTLSNIQGNGLTIPSSDFINIRGSGKLESLFNNNNNSETLYTPTYVDNIYNTGPISNRFDYKNPNKGQSEVTKLKWSAISDFARRDLNLVSKFLKSPAGQKHQIKQLLLQGFQTFDETKVYNPFSPRLSIARNSVFGLLDRPTRHIDTSNVISGIIGGTGLGSITGAIGGLLGKAPAAPAPPRSSVASEASGGLGLSTLTSLVGGGDRSSDVMRIDGGKYDVKGLLRGKTATDAYNSYRYSRLIPQSGGGFFKNLLKGVGRFIQNNTLIGGIVPPKQPWGAKYRADEKTYDYYIGSGGIFNPKSPAGGGILDGLLKTIGFGQKTSYSSAVQQRFGGTSKVSPDGRRSLVVAPNTSSPTQRTDKVGKMQYSNTTTDRLLTSRSRPQSDKKYTDVVYNNEQADIFQSDQLLNYQSMVNKESYKNFSKSQFNDITKNNFKDLFDNFAKGTRNIVGQNNEKYVFGGKSANPIGNYYGGGPTGNVMWPLQFSRFESNNDSVGQKYLNDTDPRNKNKTSENQTQQGRQIKSENDGGFPSLNLTGKGRKISPTNDTDHINSLGISSDLSKYRGLNALTEVYGPDIINFYFYDIVNKKYIPFNATVTGLNEQNTAAWDTVEYLGRADKLYHYKGFTRTLQFDFKTVARSIKELLPMWKRINYLVGLTRPSRYTGRNGFIVPPMVQLTLGDFYKNHNVVITNCQVTIPEDASWETLQESISGDWHTGLSKSIKWEKNKGGDRFAQFPKEASINLSMNIMEKERPRTGIGNWGDGPYAKDFTFSENLIINDFGMTPPDERFGDSGDLADVGFSSTGGGGVDPFQQNDTITQPSFNPTLIDTD